MAADPTGASGAVDFRTHLARESRRFAEVVAALEPTTPVPTCRDWTAADLAWHLAEVQLFWAAIVTDRIQDDEGAEAVKGGQPPRPDGYAAVLALGRAASRRLDEALHDGADSDRVWTWAEDDQNLGFVRRRQAHEALVHRVDAETAARAVGPLDPTLAADGVDEVVRVMWSGLPAWSRFEPDPTSVEFQATDVDRTWRVQTGRFTGTSPDTGTTYDERTAEVLDDAAGPPSARVVGTAADLDRWVWNRGGTVETSGDEAALARLVEVVRAGIQ